MALTFNITPGYTFSASEKVTYPKLNLLGSPVIISEGQASSDQIADGAVTTAKLASTIDINSKLSDHNIDLDKLASGTHGQILYYDSNGDLVTLDPGTSGKFLKTQGPGSDPKWEAQAGVGTITVDQIDAGGANQYLVTNSAGTEAEWATRSSSGQWTALDDPYYIAMQYNGSSWVANADTESGALPTTPTVTTDGSLTTANWNTAYDGHLTDAYGDSGRNTLAGYTNTGGVHAQQNRIDASIPISTFTAMKSTLTSFSDFSAVMASVQVTSDSLQGAGVFYQDGAKYFPVVYVTDPSAQGAGNMSTNVIPVGSSLVLRMVVSAVSGAVANTSNAYIKLTHVQLA
jgi:hypothetical protein